MRQDYQEALQCLFHEGFIRYMARKEQLLSLVHTCDNNDNSITTQQHSTQ